MSNDVKSLGGLVLSIAGLALGGVGGFFLALGGGLLSGSGAKGQAEDARKEQERRAREEALSRSIKANVQGGSLTHFLLFGQVRVGGIVVAKGTKDTDTNILHLGIAHSISHPGGCGGIGAIWLDEEKILTSEIDGDPLITDARVTKAKYVLGGNQYLVKFRHYIGTDDQLADATLDADNILGGADSSDRRRGICWTRVTYTRISDLEFFGKAFPNGAKNFSADVKGVKCYDPRLDDTNGGIGAHRLNDYDTWAWTDNNALCVATYQIMAKTDGGMGRASSRIDWPTVISAANTCDELISTPGGNIARYRCDIALDTEADHDTNLRKLLDTMRGECIPVGDKFKIYAGAWRTPSFTLDETYLRGSAQYDPKVDLDKLYNYVRVLHDDGEQNYGTVEAPPYINPSYEAEDGGHRFPKELQLAGVKNTYRAQYQGQIIGKLSRKQKTIRVVCNLMALDIEGWETGTVNIAELGIAGASYRCVSWDWDGVGPVLTLREETSDVYAVEAMTTPGQVSPVDPNLEKPFQPTGLTATGTADGIHLRWAGTPSWVATVEIHRATTSGGAYTKIAEAGGFMYVDPILDGATYFYKVYARGPTGILSDASTIASATARQAADSSGATVFNGGFESGDVSWTKETGWTIVNDPGNARSGSWCGKIAGTGSAVSRLLTNGRAFPVAPGGLVLVTGFLKSTASANGTGYVRISWRNSAGLEIGTSAGNALNPGTAYLESRVSAAAPASTASAVAEFFVGAFSSAASEAWFADDCFLTVSPKNQDEVPDGSTYGRVQQTALTTGQPDLSKSGVINRTADNLAESATRKWAAESGAQVFTGKSLTGLIDRNLGNIADDATYGRTKLTALTSGEVDLSKAGVLNRTADYITEAATRKWAAESGANITETHTSADTALVAGTAALSVAKRTGIFFSEYFAAKPSTQGYIQSAGNTGALVTTAGVAKVGANVYQMTAYEWWTFPQMLPFNPSKLYRLRVRYRATVDAGMGAVYAWLQSFDAAGVATNNNGGYDYVMVAGDTPTVAQGWKEVTTWVKGADTAYGGSMSFSTDPTAPISLHVNTSQVRPGFSANYSAGTGTVQFDYIQIEEMDEDAAVRAYRALDVSGDVKATTKIVGRAEGIGTTVQKLSATGQLTTADEIAGDGATYGRTKMTALTSGEVDMTKAGVLNRNADNIAEAASRKWAAESAATVGAVAGTNLKAADLSPLDTIAHISIAEGYRSSTQQAGGYFSESFDDPDSPSYWEEKDGNTSEKTRVAVSDSKTSGYVLRLGNNSGNDEAWLLHKRLVPFDQDVLYLVRARVRRISGTGVVYLGVAGVASDGATLVNVSGANNYSDQHYIVAQAVAPGSGWTLYSGYLKGLAATGSSSPGTSIAPAKMHTNVRYLRPLILANFADAAGQVEVDYFEILDAIAVAGVVGVGASGIQLYKGLNGSNEHEFYPIVADSGIELNLDGTNNVVKIKSTNSEKDHIYLHSERNVTSSTLANVADFKLPLEANSVYEIEATGRVATATATVGFKFGATAPASSVMDMLLTVPDTSGSTTGKTFFATGTTSVSATTTDLPAATTTYPFSAVFTVITGGTAGDFQIQFANETGSTQLTLKQYSSLTMQKLVNKTPSAALTLQNPGFAAAYTSSDTDPIGSNASLSVTCKTDGTYTIAGGTGDTVTGTPLTGNWGTPTTGGAGADYEVIFVVTNNDGGASVSNGASSYTRVDVDRVFSMSVSSTVETGVVTGNLDLQMIVRLIGTTTPTADDTMDLTVSAEAS